MSTAPALLVLGAGSWGTALALQLTRNGHTVYLWGRDPAQLAAMQKARRNPRYLPDFPLPPLILPVSDLATVPKEVEDAVLAVPCQALPGVCQQLQGSNIHRFCLSCKGFQKMPDDARHKPDQTARFNHHLVETLLRPSLVAVLAGPSFANEVAAGLPTAVTIAADTLTKAEHFARHFHSENFRAYLHDDLIGTQVGSAVKNIMAIAAGVSDGLRHGANARAALITRGAKEIMQLGLALGGRMETFMGLSGIGDLILTCSDNQSRNRRFGLALAKGLAPDAARAQITQAIEGIQTAMEVQEMAAAQGLELPITAQVVRLVRGECSPEQAVRALLSRQLKEEGAAAE